MANKKKTITLPKVPYSKIKGSGKNIVAKDFMNALKVANKIDNLNECLAILVRAKDDNGKWYYSIGITGLNDLQNGSEIILQDSPKGVKRLIVNKGK